MTHRPVWRITRATIESGGGGPYPGRGDIEAGPALRLGSITQALNDVGSASAEILGRPAVELVDRPLLIGQQWDEITIWRDDVPIMITRPVARSIATDSLRLDLRSLEHYLQRRQLGPGARGDIGCSADLVNPSFEDSAPGTFPSGWTDATGPGSAITGTTNRGVLGPQFVALVGDGTVGDFAIEQIKTFTAPVDSDLSFEVSAWWRNQPAAIDEVFDDRWIFVFTFSGGAVQEERRGSIDPGRADGTWQRVAVNIGIPAGATQDLHVRLYVPSGSIDFDEVRIRPSSRTFSVNGEDRLEFVRRLVDHGLNGGTGGGPNGALNPCHRQSTLFIGVDPAAQTTGVTTPWSVTHDAGGDYLSTLRAALSGVGDFAITPERTLMVWAPRRGVTRTSAGLDYPGGDVISAEISERIDHVADKLVPSIVDWAPELLPPSTLSGVPSEWGTVQVPSDADLEEIKDLLEVETDRRATPRRIQSVTVPIDSPPGQTIGLGDIVPISVDHPLAGVIQETGRVITMTWEPVADTVAYTFGQP